MSLCFHDVGSFVQQDVVALYDGRELVQDRLLGQIDFIEQDPVSVLNALDQSALYELEHEASSAVQLLRPLLQVHK